MIKGQRKEKVLLILRVIREDAVLLQRRQMVADGGTGLSAETKGRTIQFPDWLFMLQLHVLRVEGPLLCIVNLFSNLASVTKDLY